jgi:putative hemolysin
MKPSTSTTTSAAPNAEERSAHRRQSVGDERALEVVWASHPAEVRAAQRLRYRVFAEEMGARIEPSPRESARLDVDAFDDFCEHLLVRVANRGDKGGKVVGTYRVLTPDAARRAGGLYSETEFDLGPVRPLLATAVELGRSCIHPKWRTGGVVMALWSALGEFMVRNRLDTMVGCASIGMRDGGHSAASLWAQLRETHLAPPAWQVTPRLPLPVNDLRQDVDAELPALIKGYLRCGAKVLGPPAWDPQFNTADLPLMMRFDDLPERYRKHFLR